MPIIRSRSPVRSASERGDSTETSTTDWSMNTPDTEATAASTSTGTTATRAVGAPGTAAGTAPSAAATAAAPTQGRITRASAANANVSRPATASVSAPTPATSRAPSVRPATDSARAPASTAATGNVPSRSESKSGYASTRAPTMRPATGVAPASATASCMEPPKPKNIGGRPAVPPFASSETMVPQTKSVKSSKRAALEARREMQKRQLEVAQNAAALAQTELELAQCQSEEDLGEEFELERSTHVEEWVQHTTEYIEQPKLMLEERPIMKNDMKELADAIISVARTVQPTTAPPKIWDLPEFSGAHEEWLPFKRAFEDSMKICTTVHNMARLRKAIRGQAKEAIRGLLFVAENPQEIIDALERRFGRPEQLVLAELQKIKELTRIGDTPKDICTFASRVGNAVTTIGALKKPHYLHSPEIVRQIIEKLSPILRYRWLDYNLRADKEEPELVKMKKFLEMEADLCGVLAPPENIKKKPFGIMKQPVHAAQETYDENETVAASTTAYKKACGYCDEEHWITECRKFREVSVKDRWEAAKQKRLCFRCLRRRHQRMECRGPPCKKCKKPHHTMLHLEPRYDTAVPSTQHQKPVIENNEASTIVKSVYAAAQGTKVYLKMVPVDVYGPKGSARILALLDEGSTVTLLDANIAARIGAYGKEESLILETIGGRVIEKKDSQKLNMKIKGAHRRDKRSITGVRTVEDLQLSPQYVDKKTIEECSHLKDVMMELMYEKERPALLIGQDNWDLIISRKVLRGRQNEPVASLTSLGWVLHGRHKGSAAPVMYVNHCTADMEMNMDDLIRRHFELDSIGIKERRPSNDADGRALRILEETTKQTRDGRYESGLLWKKDDETLPNNYSQAYNRLQGTEKKLDKNASLQEEYCRQMKNLLDSDYAEEAPIETTPGRTYYLPHFAVVHPTKKKTRIVFDAAARYEGKSLNDALLPGPDLLQSLFGVLLRFREGPVAVVADIKEMFLRIQIREEDRNSLRFLWRGNERNTKPKEYRMKSVIFGAASSPATAIFVKNKNAEKNKEQYPDAARAIVRNHYMDDYLQSFAGVDEAAKVTEQVNEVHKLAGFQLRQWASNEKAALIKVQPMEALTEKRIGDEEKTLGMRWVVLEDMLAFNIGLRNTPEAVANGKRLPTKREITSAVMSTFDPMGLVAPALIKGKKLIQELWRTGLKWDETINDEQNEMWRQYMHDIAALQQLKISRCLAPTGRAGELHTFVDASETAYAAAVYWRTTSSNGEVHIALMAGKARVAPVKITSIPRLELQAALLGARLAATVSEETDLEITSRVFWSDSTTVLHWLKSDPRRFKTFVAHRLAEIEDKTKPRDWRWVPTKENPADDATRDIPRNFESSSRWFIGPDFLYKPKDEWPVSKISAEASPDDDEEWKKSTCATARVIHVLDLFNFSRFSSWTRLLRTVARVHMFVDQCRRSKEDFKKGKSNNRMWLPIEADYLRKAEETIIKQSQNESFKKEMVYLKSGKPIENSSRLKKIDVILQEDGMLRLNARTTKIQDLKNEATKLPILDGRSHVSQLLIKHWHERMHHGNHATVINELRQRYWLLSLRDAVRRVAHQCQMCRIKRTQPRKPPLGDLPPERLAHHQPPFTHTGVDYFGPMYVVIGRRKEKRWGALFTCLSTRAIHLELAASLSTSSMIMALRRMASRRGSPRTLYSDNGTNFVGANNELREEMKKMRTEDLERAAEEEGLKWKFIPPGAPSMGGAWERMVRSVKTALTAVLRERNPPEEVLYTLLTEVEHTVNSRPLTHISADPGDEEALTPNHFLIGRSCGAAILGNFNDKELIGRPNWKTAQRLADHFWTRWLREYLPTLMPRRLSGEDVTYHKGDIVIIADSSLPRNTWPRGVVEEVFPGPDGRIRIMNVRTKGGLMRRPASRLIKVSTSLPEDGVPGRPCTGGETVADVS